MLLRAHRVNKGKFHVGGRERATNRIEATPSDDFQIVFPLTVHYRHHDMRDSQPRLPQGKKVAVGSIRQAFVAKNQCGCSVGEDLSGLSEVGANQNIEIQTFENAQQVSSMI